LDVKDVVVNIDLNNLAILLDDKDIVVVGGRILGKVCGSERYSNVCGSENNEDGGAKDNDALGHEELLLHLKLLLKDGVDLVVGEVSKALLVHITHGSFCGIQLAVSVLNIILFANKGEAVDWITDV
jgi:hypothetical protein